MITNEAVRTREDTSPLPMDLYLNPVSALPLPRLFGIALILATTIPFFAGALRYVGDGKLFIPVDAIIQLFALIHVPMTVYLLFDRDIRARLWSNPLPLIGVPVFIFVACFTYFGLTAHAQSNGRAWYTAYVLLAILVWNLWHFGKQNIGVCSFLRLAQSRPGMAPAERKMLLVAAILGAAVAVTASGEYLINEYAKGHDHLYVLTLNKYAMPILKFIQCALSLYSIIYVFKHRSRFSKTGALVFLMSVSFFLGFYMTVDLPVLSLVIAGATLGHGVQYLVFLAFHSATYAHSNSQKTQKSFVTKLRMPIIFLIIVLFVSDMYKYSWIIPPNWIERVLSPFVTVSPSVLNGFSLAFINAVLLTHFWLDSCFWRFKDKPARDWMMSRYAFLFKHK